LSALATLLRQAATRLESASDSPRLDAEALLSHVTGKSRAYFRTWPERALSSEETEAFLALLEQRAQGQPIAYLLGKREFWSREFVVTQEALIPRPETELLVELALARIAPGQPAQIADLGTGTGALAITLGLELPLAQITAVDISPQALAIAQRNAARLGAANIRFLQGDWLQMLAPRPNFDLIVSNPPYIASGDPHLEQGDVRFEPRLALVSGVEGLDAIRQIVQASPQYLQAGGWLLLEHGYDQAEAARRLLREAGLQAVESHRDLAGCERASGGRRQS
jgi:release factor glutamine methyltransferase